MERAPTRRSFFFFTTHTREWIVPLERVKEKEEKREEGCSRAIVGADFGAPYRRGFWITMPKNHGEEETKDEKAARTQTSHRCWRQRVANQSTSAALEEGLI